MSELSDLLDQLPVPDHDPGFWTNLEAQLAGVPVASSTTGSTQRDGQIDMDLTGTIDELEQRRRMRNWLLAAVATAAALLAIVIGYNALTEGTAPAPVITDNSTTTTTQPETDDAIRQGPTIRDLDWAVETTPIPSSDTQDFLGLINWSAPGFTVYDREADTLFVSSDGREWAPADFLPAGFNPGGVTGYEDDWVVATHDDVDFDRVAPVTVAVSGDEGATWETLPSITPRPFRSPVATPWVQGASAFVLDDTVLLSVFSRIVVDNEAALSEAGYAVDELTIFRGNWTDDNGYVVSACAVPDAHTTVEGSQACADKLAEYPLGDLGLDRTRMRFGSMTTFYRSVAGGAFEPVEVPTVSPINTMVVAGEFVVLAGDTEGENHEILRSADGLNWASSPFPGGRLNNFQSAAVVSTGRALFSRQDDNVIRSTDNGRTWDTLSTPGGEIDRLVAGPGGVVVLGRLLGEPVETPPPLVIERDGYTLRAAEVGGIAVIDSAGTTVAESGAGVHPSGFSVEPIAEGPNYLAVKNPDGEIVLEITVQEVVDLILPGNGEGTPETRVIAWSPDGEGLVWQPAAEAFAVSDGLTASVNTIGVGETTIIAELALSEPARPVDFRSLIDDMETVDPIDGQATVMMGGPTTTQTFIADIS